MFSAHLPHSTSPAAADLNAIHTASEFVCASSEPTRWTTFTDSKVGLRAIAQHANGWSANSEPWVIVAYQETKLPVAYMKSILRAIGHQADAYSSVELFRHAEEVA